jgi:type II restriction enzyme
MKYLDYYKNKNIKEDKVFEYFLDNLQFSIKDWDYFINWNKVKREANKYKDELNLLNGLISCDNIKDEFIRLVTTFPNIIKVLPILIAVRDKEISIRKFSNSNDLSCINFNFAKINSISIDEAEKLYFFFERSGLKNIFQNKQIRNIQDYLFGLEAGLDTNGRKNRGGHLMENLVEFLIKPILERNNLEYIKEANAKKIKEKWGLNINVNKSSRRFDFVIYNKSNNKYFIIETNFFNGGGSKPKSVCGEFKGLFKELSAQNMVFIWITDGEGWLKEKRPFEESYIINDYVFNLKMIIDGVLDELI